MSQTTLSTVLGIDTCRTVAFGAIGATYIPIGAQIENAGRMILLQNWTDADLWFSDNGVDNKFPLRANDKIILDITTNQSFSRGLFLPYGSYLYVKQKTVPSLGEVHVTLFYGE